MKRLVLVRHGESVWNKENRFTGWTDVDLSEKGHQPMLSDDEKITITFNGEIYNFKKIRKELEGLGYHFKSNSDTEVILKSYEEWGTEMFSRFDGMFAIALVDLEKQKLALKKLENEIDRLL